MKKKNGCKSTCVSTKKITDHFTSLVQKKLNRMKTIFSTSLTLEETHFHGGRVFGEGKKSLAFSLKLLVKDKRTHQHPRKQRQ